MTETQLTASEIRGHIKQLRHSEMFAFADELETVLDAAVIERYVLRVLIEKAQAMSDLVSYKHRPITRLDIMALDDALMGAGAVFDETKWLGEDEEEGEGCI